MNPRSNGSHAHHTPSNAAIIAEAVAKQYHIGLREQRRDTLLQSAVAVVTAPLANLRRLRRLGQAVDDEAPDVLWALRDASFRVAPGAGVGLLGRHRAGHSTPQKTPLRHPPPHRARIVPNRPRQPPPERGPPCCVLGRVSAA